MLTHIFNVLNVDFENGLDFIIFKYIMESLQNLQILLKFSFQILQSSNFIQNLSSNFIKPSSMLVTKLDKILILSSFVTLLYDTI